MLQPTSLSGASGVYVKPNENEYWAPDESSQTANRLHIGYVLTDLLNNSLNDIAASKTSKTSKIENWDDLSSSDYTTILHNASEETFIHMVCRSLLHDQCLTKSDQLTNMFLSFESTDNPNIYTIPAKKEDPPIGLLLNLSVVDEPIMTMYIPGMPKVALSVTLTGDKPHCKLLRKYIDKVPDWVAQITAWRAWAKVNAPGEYRAEALSRVKAYIYNRACNRASALELELANLMLTSLPELPAGLEKLDVSGNQLCSLPVLPAGLVMLDVSNNQLSGLPALPGYMRTLNVSNNQLTSLPDRLPSGLEMLNVCWNKLTSKPSRPPSRPNAWYFGCTINYEPQRPRSGENPSAEVSDYTP
ncbi:hypothetical protein [Escherichia coli]|uniref:Leucine-rich repeat domain-containing protein n=1 Tax=Escherichia coli TaxID=562 RepID=A0AAW7VF69_ECOLX|nr:hypothetical protein [Escherichia coli]MDO2730615.1 hypothetical protein [Escherichia coli]